MTLRIGYVATTDPRDRWGWSGTHHYMFHALAARATVVPLVPVPETTRLARLIGRFAARPAPGPLAEAELAAARLQRLLRAHPVDVLLAPVASTVIAQYRGTHPLAVLSDATFRLLRAEYPGYRAMPDATAEAYDALERRSIARADLLLYPSRWAADSAVRDYGADPARIRVIPLGANIDDVPPAAAALAHKRHTPTCRLLFIGRDWARKGGAVAVDTVAALARRGIASELTVVGSRPSGATPPGVVVAGNLDKKRSADQQHLRALLERAHFLILPTQADCYSMVSCEANAFAVPAVISAVGGIPGLIADGENGVLLPPHADGDAYAAAIAAVWSEPTRYAALAAGARRAYDSRLNWDSWGDAVTAELVALVARGVARGRVA